MIKQLSCILIFITILPLFSASTDKIAIPHSAMGKSFYALVVIPETYNNKKLRFPVIYLLHGFGGNYSSFSQIVDLGKYADSCSILLVCPDGNSNSWYLNSPVKRKSQFATYIVHDVITCIDSAYRTITSADARALIGTSMGGHGALTLLAGYPELFCGAGSISGILDLTAFPHEWLIARVLGPCASNKNRWQNHSFLYSMESLTGKKKAIIIDCGRSDFALAVNRSAHAKMEKLGIAHEYHERPGGHSYRYVQKVLPYHIGYFARYMRNK